MPISFENVGVGAGYTRIELAKMWGYASYEAIARGIITPAGLPVIVLFVTAEKRSFLPQYKSYLYNGRLATEGETGHRTDKRLVESSQRGDEIHLFYRECHPHPFTYKGLVVLESYELQQGQPSRFTYSLKNSQ